MENIEELIKLILNREKCRAKEFLDNLLETSPSYEYGKAREKILLIEVAKYLNNTIPSFYFDFEQLTRDLFCENPISKEEVLSALCEAVKASLKEDNKHSFEKALSYIHTNFCDNQLTMGAVSEYAGISQSGLVKLFTENTGMTPGDYLGKLRTQKSIEYLKAGLTIEQAALKVGFFSSETYIRTFKKFMNMTPGAWKRNN